jgi:hypothetical protein
MTQRHANPEFLRFLRFNYLEQVWETTSTIYVYCVRCVLIFLLISARYLYAKRWYTIRTLRCLGKIPSLRYKFLVPLSLLLDEILEKWDVQRETERKTEIWLRVRHRRVSTSNRIANLSVCVCVCVYTQSGIRTSEFIKTWENFNHAVCIVYLYAISPLVFLCDNHYGYRPFRFQQYSRVPARAVPLYRPDLSAFIQPLPPP